MTAGLRDTSAEAPAEAAFLLTDVEGSTALWDGEPGAMAAALARHDALMRAGIGGRGGRVFKTAGDAFYATFARSADALAAAVSLQQTLAREAWPTSAPIRVRMALAAGEAAARDGDYFGPPLNVAARLLSVCRGGQVLATASLAQALPEAGIAGVRGESHGHYRLKGVRDPVEVVELGMADAVAFAPPEDTQAVYRVMPDGGLWQPVRLIRHNLPAERDAFVGRAHELDALAQRLDAGARLVTVLGPGGAGKTRFVRRYARVWLGDWPGGVYFCDLSEARDLAGVLGAVAFALEVPLSHADAAVQLGHAIAARGRCLVLLDNFEQVAVHADATLRRWLERAPEAAFVVTTRERLRLPGEVLFPLAPLPIADEAIELFVARARAQRADLALGAEEREHVARIVALLDGLPLAIELAAARVRVLTPAQIVERMRDRFALLAGARGEVARQATLRAAIDWSWNLLAPWEQAALAQCAVFEGGFTLEHAERVIDLHAYPDAPPVLDAIQSLVDKSLLRSYVPADMGRYAIDELYFGMYVSIHEYAAERLHAFGHDAEAEAQARHGRCFAAFGSDVAIEALYGPDGNARRRAMTLELDNIVAACQRAVRRDDGAVAAAAFRAAWEILDLQGPFATGVALGASVLAVGTLAPRERIRAGLVHARALQRGGRSAAALTLLESSLALAVHAGERDLAALLRGQTGAVLRALGSVPEAQACFDAALAEHRALGSRRAEASMLMHLGTLHADQGQVEPARALFEQALAIQRELGNRLGEANVLSQFAVMLGDAGQLAQTQACFEASLAICREIGDRVAEAEALNNLGCLHQDLGRLDDARRYFEEALAMHRAVGNRRFEGYALGDLGRLHLDEGRHALAQACLTQSLAIMRELGDRRIEGSELRSLAELCLRQGERDDEARALFEQAESVLRSVGDKNYLAQVLCGRGELARRAGDLPAARALLVEAREMARAMAAAPESLLGRRIAALAAALGEALPAR